MADTHQVKAQVDCRELIARDLGLPPVGGHSHNKWWKWLCPFHQEKTPSFTVTAEGWICWGCNKHGDAFTWLQEKQGMSFVEALKALGGLEIEFKTYASGSRRYAVGYQKTHIAQLAQAPDQAMQAIGLAIIEEAERNLWSEVGTRALVYLVADRGLNEETIRTARLGYIPGHYKAWVDMQGIKMPAGIVIPWLADQELFGIKVRRSGGPTKYHQPAGFTIAHGLYWVDHVEPGKNVLLIEGEFNALTAWQELKGQVCPVSMGSASNTLNIRWVAHLAGAPSLFAVFDRDPSGEKGAARLSALADRIRFLNIPDPHKDMNDFVHSNQGRGTVQHWWKTVSAVPGFDRFSVNEMFEHLKYFLAEDIHPDLKRQLDGHTGAFDLTQCLKAFYLSYNLRDRERFVRSLPEHLSRALDQQLKAWRALHENKEVSING